MRRTAWPVVVAAVLSIGGLLVAATPAFADCIPTPQVSAHRFTGTVVKVENEGRTATVRTDDGRTVIVRGSPVDGPNAASSVDRTYTVGLRYEFHPTNDASPYSDSICTATHLVGPPVDASSPSATPPAARRGAALARWWRGGLGLLLVVGAGIGFWLVSRRRQP